MNTKHRFYFPNPKYCRIYQFLARIRLYQPRIHPRLVDIQNSMQCNHYFRWIPCRGHLKGRIFRWSWRPSDVRMWGRYCYPNPKKRNFYFLGFLRFSDLSRTYFPLIYIPYNKKDIRLQHIPCINCPAFHTLLPRSYNTKASILGRLDCPNPTMRILYPSVFQSLLLIIHKIVHTTHTPYNKSNMIRQNDPMFCS